MGESSYEDRIQRLTSGNSESHRTKWALEWKRRAKPVIGLGCSYVPAEVIRACGILPWRITGSWSTDLNPLATLHRPNSTDPYYTHMLDARLKGDLDFLDGAVFTNKDDDMRRLYDVWVYVRNTDFAHIMFLPYHKRESAIITFRTEISKLLAAMESLAGRRVDQAALLDAIEEYNKMRSLLLKLYELRKRNRPALSGTEALGITTTAQVMPVDLFNEEVESLLPYLDGRTAQLGNRQCEGPRLMVSSDGLDNPAFIQLIEEVGAVVVMDDMDTGSRWFWREVDMSEAKRDPLRALAFRYLARPSCPRMSDWYDQITQTIAWAHEYRVNGVIDFTQRCNYTRQFRMPMFRKVLEEAGFPVLSIAREYNLVGAAQLRTRIEAFVEMLTN